MRVPVYNQSQVQPTLNPRPMAGDSAPVPTAGAAGLEKASRVMWDIVAQEKKETDASMVMETQASLNKNVMDLQTKALAREGRDALDNATMYEAFDKVYKEHQAKLVNDEQRFLFQQQTGNDRNQFSLALERHAAGQGQVLRVNNGTALVETDLQKLSTLYKDTEAFNQQLKVAQAHTLDLLHMQGIAENDPAATRKLAELRSKAYVGRIKQMMVDNPAAASGYFEGVSQDIGENERVVLKATLRGLSTKQAGMDTALELAAPFKAVSTTGDLWTARDQALTDARTRLKGDTDALNIAETQIRQMASEREQGIKIMQTEAAAPVYAAMTKAREANRIPSLNDIPREAWVTLQRTDPDKANDILKGIQAEVRADAERREAKAERRERRALVDEQHQEIINQRRNFADLWGSPGSLAVADLSGMVAMGSLSPSQGATLEQRRKSANQDTLYTETKEIERIMSAAKVKPKTEQADQVIGYIEQRKAAFQADNGRAPKVSEVADMAREALYKVDADWTPFDKPAYKMTLDDVPKEHRAAITAERKKRGLPTSDSDIISTYARGQARKAKGGK